MKPRLMLAVLVAVCAIGGAAAPAEAQQVVFVVRHAAPPVLRSMDVIKDETPLSETGRDRAVQLANSLRDAGITVIYATDTVRTVQTAEPIAKQLGLPIRQVPRRDVEGLVQRLRSDHRSDRVLVVTHWNTLPATLQALGHPVEVKIAQAARDEIFVLVPVEAKPPVVVHMRY